MLFAFSPVTLGASRTEESASISNTTDVKLNLGLRWLCCVCYTFRALSLKPYCSSRVNAGFHYSNSVTLPQRCKVCKKNFANVYRLQRHMISHDESAVLRRFKCADCGKAFKFKHHLKVGQHFVTCYAIIFCGWDPFLFQLFCGNNFWVVSIS